MIPQGSTVKMHYTLTVEGRVVDSSSGGDPLEFVHGEGQIIPGLEDALSGLSQGDKKHVTVAPEQGYGPVHEELVQKVPKQAFKDGDEPNVGAVVSGRTPSGQFQAMVTAVSESEVTLDLNHPLAGKTLDFDVEVVSIAPPASKIIRP